MFNNDIFGIIFTRLKMLTRIRELFNVNIDRDVLNDATYDDGTAIFTDHYSSYLEHDLLGCIEEAIYKFEDFTYDKFVSIVNTGKLSTFNDLIFNLPIFSNEAEQYRLKRSGEDLKEDISESLYHCSKCKRPVAAQTRQTRAADEGVSVFVHCGHCNISRQV